MQYIRFHKAKLLIVICFVLWGCGPAMSTFQSDSLRLYNGNGYQISYPVSARVRTELENTDARDELHIEGAQITIEGKRVSSFDLVIRTYNNKDVKGLNRWIKNYYSTKWQQTRRLLNPPTLPVDVNGNISNNYISDTTVGPYKAIVVNTPDVKFIKRTFYLYNKKIVYAIEYKDYELAYNPLADVQLSLYSLILSTFQLTK